jgi:hypothetical protein
MTDHSNGRSRLKPATLSNRIFDVELYPQAQQKTFSEVRDYLLLKRAMRRAVLRDSAPHHLVDSIRNMIRE